MKAGKAVMILVSAGLLAGMSSSSAAPMYRTGSSDCPLTGQSAPSGINVGRAAVAVKVDNGPGAAAPALAKADVVFESLVEGGITRFTAVFHCKDAGAVGPVRSARADDPAFVTPFTRALAYSGANEYVAEELDARGMVSVTEAGNPGAFQRSASQLMVDTGAARSAARSAGVSAPPALKFGTVQGSSKARVVTLDFGGTDVQYRWNDSAWQRSQNGRSFVLDNGKQAKANNVLVWEVDVHLSTEVFDSVGTPSPELTLEGSGRALLFRDGHVVRGSWTKSGDDTLPVFKTKDGTRFRFAKGTTWIELVPSAAGDVTGSVSFR